MRKLAKNPSGKLISINAMDIGRLLLAIVFLIAIYFFISANPAGTGINSKLLIIAAIIGGYMALNIGANDVANNVGPAVGAGAMTLTGAIFIAVVFEASGALIAGGNVVETIKKGIIDPQMIADTATFIWVMTAALLSAAIWLNIATYSGAPVSTTHSIVGGVLGAGIAAGGWGIADWGVMQKIIASWVISPALGGVIAAAFLLIIRRAILERTDKKKAAITVVPILMAIMALVFVSYLTLKGLKHIHKFSFPEAGGIGLVAGIIVYLLVRIRIHQRAENIKDIDSLFTLPLIVGAAFLSFAHGANDVANAVGPLAAINDAVVHGIAHGKASIPIWVMLIGALGIAFGLALYGPKLIKTVGNEITELDKVRAFCVALSAAITVIIASQFGLPVSSTHIAVGGIFGVGFLREHLHTNYNQKIDKIRRHMREMEEKDEETIDAFIEKFNHASLSQKKVILSNMKRQARAEEITWWERRRVKKAFKAQLVERSMLLKIVAAWIFTVPVAGLLSAAIFFMIRGMLVVSA
ncbi:MAG: inorganic phosphate transporter [Robiginitomaculum sp.]